MNSHHGPNAVIPFPEFPPAMAAGLPADGIGMRMFGTLEKDLEVDFECGRTPAVISEVLGLCAVDPESSLPEDFFRELTVGKRLECSLALAAGEARSPFTFPFQCSACGVELETELTLEEISEIQREADRSDEVQFEMDGRSHSLRKPRGLDQESWEGREFRDEVEAARAMIGTLCGDQEFAKNLEVKEIDLIEDALDTSDPLVNFLCGISCSECGTRNELLIDLYDVALGMLSRLQQQLILTVHKLASHYHWTEDEIFEIPHWRRLKYLRLIADGR